MKELTKEELTNLLKICNSDNEDDLCLAKELVNTFGQNGKLELSYSYKLYENISCRLQMIRILKQTKNW